MTRPAPSRSNSSVGRPGTVRDDVLLDAAHSGDAEALAALRERYRGTALAVARTRTGSAEEAEDVAAAALGRIEQVVGEGGGPRAFLGAFVVWMTGREADGGARPIALPDDPRDPASLLRVFSGLPAEWQAFLWQTEILGHSARRAAAARGFGAVAAAGLHRDVFRGLRGFYVQAAADRAAGPDCAEFSGELAHFVRGTRGQRSRRDVKEHLDGCARCTGEYLGRQDIGTGLRTWTLPVLAGLPLWGTEALELADLVAGADTGAGAVPGTAGAGAGAGAVAAAGAGAAGARAEEAAGTTPWSGRGARVLLGAGALATVVAAAAVGVSAGGDPVPVAGSVAAEQAPRTTEDLEDPSADGPASGAERAGDESGDGPPAAGRGQGSDRSAPLAAGPVPDGGPAGALRVGAQPVAAAVLADAETVVAAGAGGRSGTVPSSSGGDGAARPAAGTDRGASGSGGTRATAAEAPGTASSGGTSRDASSGGSSAGTPAPSSERQADRLPAGSSPAREAAIPSPDPSASSSLPTVAASPAPLKAPVAPVAATEPPSGQGSGGTAPDAGSRHTDRSADAPKARGDGSGHGGQSWNEGREQNGNGGHGKGRGQGNESWNGRHGGHGDSGKHGGQGDSGKHGGQGHSGEQGDPGWSHRDR